MSRFAEPGSYDHACQLAATDQGLDPIGERLTAEGIPWVLEQTGGFTMTIGVYRSIEGRPDGAYLWIVSEAVHGGDPGTWGVGEYGWDDTVEAEEGRPLGTERYAAWSEYAGHPADDAVRAIRAWLEGSTR